MALQPTPECFRAEISRHMLTRASIAEVIRMNKNQLTNFVNANTPLTGWAAHNIGYGINYATGLRLFDVDESRGVLKAPRGRPKGYKHEGLGLESYLRPTRKKKRKRWY